MPRDSEKKFCLAEEEIIRANEAYREREAARNDHKKEEPSIERLEKRAVDEKVRRSRERVHFSPACRGHHSESARAQQDERAVPRRKAKTRRRRSRRGERRRPNSARTSAGCFPGMALSDPAPRRGKGDSRWRGGWRRRREAAAARLFFG